MVIGLFFFICYQDEDLKRKDREEWTDSFEEMRDLLKKGADLAFDAGKIGGQTKEKYAMSGDIYIICYQLYKVENILLLTIQS